MTVTTDAAALSHANPGLEGIVTREGVITEFPGGIPTQGQVDAWEAQYAAFLADPVNSPTTLDDVIEAAGITDAQLRAAKRRPGRPSA